MAPPSGGSSSKSLCHPKAALDPVVETKRIAGRKAPTAVVSSRAALLARRTGTGLGIADPLHRRRRLGDLLCPAGVSRCSGRWFKSSLVVRASVTRTAANMALPLTHRGWSGDGSSCASASLPPLVHDAVRLFAPIKAGGDRQGSDERRLLNWRSAASLKAGSALHRQNARSRVQRRSRPRRRSDATI